MHAALMLFGLELSHLPSGEGADSLGSSLSVIESGGWALSSYEGPTLQPMISLKAAHLDLSLLPGLAWSHNQATSADGRSADVNVLQARVGGLALVALGPWRAGLEGAWSGGRATLEGEAVASAPNTWTLGPTAGFDVSFSQRWHLGLRARAPISLSEGDLSGHLGGAVCLRWAPADGAP